MPIVTASSLLQTSNGEGDREHELESGVTKVTLQHIMNKQLVARNIYYSLYSAVSPRISQTRVCGKNDFSPLHNEDSPTTVAKLSNMRGHLQEVT